MVGLVRDEISGFMGAWIEACAFYGNFDFQEQGGYPSLGIKRLKHSESASCNWKINWAENLLPRCD